MSPLPTSDRGVEFASTGRLIQPRICQHVSPRQTERRSNTSTSQAGRGPQHLVIECVTPELDAGRYRVKRVIGDVLSVGADVIKDGHDLLLAQLTFRGPSLNRRGGGGGGDWEAVPMRYDFDADRWFGELALDEIGRWFYSVEAWTDVFGTWRSGLQKKADAGQDVRVELLEGAIMVRAAARRAKTAVAKAALTQTAKALENPSEGPMELRVERALDDEVEELMREWAAPKDLTRYARVLEVEVDRPRAAFAAWYEMFPRSAVGPAGTGASGRPDGSLAHGTFVTAAEALPRIAGLGFDVVYLPPIHPIGHTYRKGKNNALKAGPDDVGSPWAIGSEYGGHDAVDPRLGTIADFERFVQRAESLGLEVALDYALQCSPDHPWVQEHPDWFHIRPDGTIQYAENPPKKYQDIYPINFWCEDRQALWDACRDVVRFWISKGVRTFRVDNPHTKPLAFWEWLIDDIQRDDPNVIFFAEAFTRPKRMKSLAKLGFTMSYTYFTWKNAHWELRPYVEELTQTPMVEYFRGNFFVNTPDILTEYLVHGGRPAFRVRLLLAATMMPLYGMYSGFELVENVPLRAGSEEYLDSEKYELKARDFSAPGNLDADIRRLNEIRREHRALQVVPNLTFHLSENPEVLFFRKAGTDATTSRAEGRGEDLLIAVNLDPHRVQATMVHVPIADMGIADDEPYVVHDLLTGDRYTWRGVRNYVRLDPAFQAGHVLRVEVQPAVIGSRSAAP